MAEDNIIYGINAVKQIISSKPHQVLELYVASDNKRVQQVYALAAKQGVLIQTVKMRDLERYGNKHQGIVARIKPSKMLAEADLKNLVTAAKNPLLLILDQVQDPHNLGACLRTADAVGATAVIVPQDNSAKLTATVRKVASGAAETVPVVQVTNLARVMRELQELGVWIVGTCGDATDNLYDLDLAGGIALVMGAEESGLRTLTKKHCDFLAKLPMHGMVESLNVSVAAGVCLYEIIRQRSL